MQTQVGDWIAPELSVEPKSLRLHGIVGGESPEDKFLIKFKNGYTEDLIYPMIRMTTESSYFLLQVADELTGGKLMVMKSGCPGYGYSGTKEY